MPHDLQKREPYPPFFQAVLTPHRSLSRRGVNIVLWCAGLIVAFYSIVLVLMGLWPAPILLSLPSCSSGWPSGTTSQPLKLTRK
ncbi:DUF2244 domain-containing protein, partial [Pseudovibrio denitrificans]|uniref:DUF2244 domain-containing protein n=1 Tax=Pseudovibrio denitrificans TaxID=258256 RepID=UPI001AD8AB86